MKAKKPASVRGGDEPRRKNRNTTRRPADGPPRRRKPTREQRPERSYQLSHARETNQALLQQKEALERQVLEAQAAPALAEAARNLGMIPSRDTAHLVQDASGNWVVVGTPKPAQGAAPPPLNAPLTEEAPPAPPAPPAPRVVEPRE